MGMWISYLNGGLVWGCELVTCMVVWYGHVDLLLDGGLVWACGLVTCMVVWYGHVD
eukprot:NODE_8038_length_300_cov_55.517928_g7299_i0.p1 GENE.NODE_8038_length_300_cov_55.517928_g7299_i0~~NODE_8038_length_300_cov_55.517928_g7299_i0.p1  ORF type:complete len:56 (+),score=5.45 NODE_8038_length_300_cov_55.517928_g7299_i0:28-195(+)